MPTKEAVLAALRNVLDPEIGINIVDLNMVRDVRIQDGRVDLTIALTVPHCPLAATLKTDTSKALASLEGITHVEVETTSMTPEELSKLRETLQSKVRERTSGPHGSVGPGIDRLDKRGIRNMVAIVSGKGGVGKSFVTGMLATELRRRGYEVGVLDADLTGPSIAKIFGVTDRPYKSEAGILPVPTSTGIKIMSVNLVVDDPGTPMIWRGPIVNSVIRQLYWEVDWGDLHYMLVDLPPGTSDAPLTVFQSLPLDGVIVITSPQDLAAMIVTKAVNMARKLNVPILGLIENMSHIECPHCGDRIEVYGRPKGREFAQKLGVPFLGEVPLDPEIARLSDEGRLEQYSSPVFSKVAEGLRVLALTTVEQTVQGLPIAWSSPPTQ